MVMDELYGSSEWVAMCVRPTDCRSARAAPIKRDGIRTGESCQNRSDLGRREAASAATAGSAASMRVLLLRFGSFP